MSETSPGFVGDRLLCAAAAAHLAVSLHVSPPIEQPAVEPVVLEQTIAPQAANYAAIDYAIANREDLIGIAYNDDLQSMRGYPTTFDEMDRRIGVRTHQDAIEAALSEIDLDLSFYRDASEEEQQRAAARREELKPVVFARLQQFAKEVYNIDVVLRSEPRVQGGPADSPPGAYPILQPATIHDVSFGTIYNIARSLGELPDDFLGSIGVDTIRLYVLEADKKGRGPTGTVDGQGGLDIAVNAGSSTVSHEAAHELNRKFFGDWYAPDPVFDSYRQPILGGEGLHGLIMDNKNYEETYATAIEAARNTDDDKYYDLTEAEARCVVAQDYPMSAYSVASFDGHNPNSEEAKAYLYEHIMTNPVATLLDRCKTRMFAITRELLARLHTVHPRWAEWLAVQHTPSSFQPDDTP